MLLRSYAPHDVRFPPMKRREPDQPLASARVPLLDSGLLEGSRPMHSKIMIGLIAAALSSTAAYAACCCDKDKMAGDHKMDQKAPAPAPAPQK